MKQPFTFLFAIVQYSWGFLCSLYAFVGLFYASCLGLVYIALGGKSPAVINGIIYQYVWLQVVFFGGVRLRIEGAQHLDRARTYIVTFNHASLMDPPIGYYVLAKLGFHTRMLGKAELFRIPVLGHALRAVKFVEVNRRNLAAALKSYEQLRANMATGISYWVAAEGTRSADGRLKTFKKGGFITAIQTQAQLLPICIKGTQRVIPKSGWVVRAFMPVTVVIGPPLDASQYTLEQKEQLMQRAFNWFAATLGDEQKPLPGTPAYTMH
jgi:1-acyl-sn-glycerol-3-phosphate acyltransferase